MGQEMESDEHVRISCQHQSRLLPVLQVSSYAPLKTASSELLFYWALIKFPGAQEGM